MSFQIVFSFDKLDASCLLIRKSLEDSLAQLNTEHVEILVCSLSLSFELGL